MKHIFFDLDGTLVESALGITKAVQRALAHFGIVEKNLEKLEVFIGPPLFDSFQKYYHFSKEQYDTAIDVFHDYYNSIGIFECKLYDGIEDVLRELVENGKKLYVASSKPEEQARKVITHFGLDDYFVFVGGADGDHGTKRSTKAAVIEYVMRENHLSNQKDIAMVGDRCHDVLGARENHLPCVGVLYGYGNQRELEQVKATVIVRSPKQIPAALCQL